MSMHAAADVQLMHPDSTLPTKGNGKERMKDALHHLSSKERERLKANLCLRFIWDAALARVIAVCGQEQ